MYVSLSSLKATLSKKELELTNRSVILHIIVHFNLNLWKKEHKSLIKNSP